MAGLSLALLAIPLFVGVAVFYLRLNVWPTVEGYRIGDQVNAMRISGPVLIVNCVFAAVVGVRAGRSRVLVTARTRRSTLACAMSLCWPLPLAAALVLAASLGLTSAMSGQGLVVDWRLFIVAIAECFTYSLVGVAMGLALPPLVALPAAAFLPFVLIGFGPAVNPSWLQHLVTVETSCCAIDADLASAPIAAHLLVLALISGAGWWLVRHAMLRPLLGRQRSFTVLAMVAALVAAFGFAYENGPDLWAGVTPRSGEPSCSRVGSMDVCLWPEHESARPENEKTLRSVQEIARRSGGIHLPSRFTERSNQRWPVASINTPPLLGPESGRDSMLDALVPDLTCGTGEASGAASDAWDSVEGVRLWWAKAMGIPIPKPTVDDGILFNVPSDKALAVVKAIEATPRESQARPINAIIDQALALCRAR